MDMLTVHMEHGLPLMSGLDLGLILSAQERFEQHDQSAIMDALQALGKAGGLRTIRKLSAVVNASAEDLLESELAPAKWDEMEKAAALRPFAETFADALRFFSEWAASLGAPRASSESQEASPEDPNAEKDDSRLGDS